MKTYLVGGWVRDYLRGESSQDRDWVVVGSTPADMLSQGFQAVGASFPVFLHPRTKEEYALARQERKVAAGYHGFSVISDSSVTLVDDLSRRDLTINAIAYDPNTQDIIDPFDGQKDLEAKVLRHVSSAFLEDPLRLLRLARFYAVFSDMTVHETTLDLCHAIVASGELQSLVPERVRLEVFKMYQTSKTPHRFWQLLQSTGALDILFPQLQGATFNLSLIPSTCMMSDPFVAGLLGLKPLIPTEVGYHSLVCQLRASRAEWAFITIAQAFDRMKTLTYEALITLISETRALHDLAPIAKVYHWNITDPLLSWSTLEAAVTLLKHADLQGLDQIEPLKKKSYIFHVYLNILQDAQILSCPQ